MRSEDKNVFLCKDGEIPMPKPKKSLHKDTDLGYFSAFFVASGCDVSDSVEKAKRLINKLNQETK